MKITVVNKIPKGAKEMYVSDAVCLEKFKIKIFFTDGSDKTVDFSDFLSKEHLHPSLKKYRVERTFGKFEIMHGNLVWNDYEMIFPVEQLYDGKIL